MLLRIGCKSSTVLSVGTFRSHDSVTGRVNFCGVDFATLRSLVAGSSTRAPSLSSAAGWVACRKPIQKGASRPIATGGFLVKDKNLTLLGASTNRGRNYYFAKSRKKEKFGAAIFASHLCQDSAAIAKKRMKVQMIIASTPSSEVTVPSLLLKFDTKSYLFNCSEGLQRICASKKLRLTKVKDIFLSRVSWKAAGGLPGMLLTLADSMTSRNTPYDLNIYGGPNMGGLLAATRHFIFRNNVPVRVKEIFESKEFFSDENIKVQSIVNLPEDWLHVDDMHDNSDIHKVVVKQIFSALPNDDAAGDIQVDYDLNFPMVEETQKAWLARNERKQELLSYRFPPTTSYPAALSYLITCHEVPGKFDIVKARQLGLQPGPVFKTLVDGESVTLEINGEVKVIKPHDVIGLPKPGNMIAVLDVPNRGYVSGIITSPILENLHKHSGGKVIFHILGKGVSTDPKYVKWMQKFDETIQQIILDSDSSPNRINHTDWALGQMALNSITPNIFVQPQYSNTLPRLILDHNISSSIQQNTTHRCSWIANPPNMTTMNLEPEIEFIKGPDGDFKCDAESLRQKFANDDEYERFLTVAAEAKEEIRAKENSSGLENQLDDIEIMTLGTGSAMPSKYRNVSAILVRFPKTGSILLDCGEGTLGQLSRAFGNNLNKVFDDIQCIFISHLHADHHLGCLSLIQSILDTHPSKTLFICGPWRYRIFLNEYAAIESIDLQRIVFIANSHLIREEQAQNIEIIKRDVQALKKNLGLSYLNSVLVDHCPHAYGIVLGTLTGKKIVYSGDTRPCKRLIEEGMDADILIHESTFDDDMFEQARLRRHSTTNEAIAVAQSMHAKNLLLTHFSQRYPKLPLYVFNKEPNGGEIVKGMIGVSFDLMRIKLRDVWKLNAMYKALQILYSDQEDEMLKKRKLTNEAAENGRNVSKKLAGISSEP